MNKGTTGLKYKIVKSLQYKINLSGNLWVAECPALSLVATNRSANDALEQLEEQVTNLILEAPYLDPPHFFSEEILRDRFLDPDYDGDNYWLLGQALHSQKTETFEAKLKELRPEWKNEHFFPIPNIDDGDDPTNWDRAEHLAKLDFGRLGMESEMWKLWIKLALWWNKEPVPLVNFGNFEKIGVVTLGDRIKRLGVLSPWKEADILSLTEDEALTVRDNICLMGSEKDNLSFDVTWDIGSTVADFIEARTL